MIRIPSVVDRLAHRYPSVLVDAVTDHEPGRRIVAVKNVTVSEELFQGHFPGAPLMPGVLMIESRTQVATLPVAGPDLDGRRARLRGVYNAKFRRQVVPGDRLELEVTMGRRRGSIVRTRAVASVDGHVVAEAKLVLAFERTRGTGRHPGAVIHETAIVHPRAVVGEGTVIGPYAIVGSDVAIGRHCTVGASAVVEGCTTIGDRTEI